MRRKGKKEEGEYQLGSQSGIDEKILAALWNAQGEALSGEELAAQLGISRAAVWSRIQMLRKLGYHITATPHVGYRLLSGPDGLYADDLKARLGSVRCIGREIYVYQQTGSTNDVVDRLGRNGLPEGVVVFAEAQTQGRGRMGRSWISHERKGLWFSVLLRPPWQPFQAGWIMLMAAVAVARVLERYAKRSVRLKWPNDVMIDGYKVAGILTELRAELDRIHYVVLGIGVNVNQQKQDFPQTLRNQAGSLRMVVGYPVDRPACAVDLLRELDRLYATLVDEGCEAVAEEWRWRSDTLGKKVRVDTGTAVVEGVAEALDENGGLVVRTHRGKSLTLQSGMVTYLSHSKTET